MLKRVNFGEKRHSSVVKFTLENIKSIMYFF